MLHAETIRTLRVPPGKKVRLRHYHTSLAHTSELRELSGAKIKEHAKRMLEDNLKELREAQELFYADNRYSVLVVLQAMDAAGKDGTIKHVMSGVNPQGCQVFSFKHPSAEEIDHNFLWRYMQCLPERGRIGIFNRSYYEDVLIVKVHPEILAAQPLPRKTFDNRFWRERYEDINAFERHLVRNGTIILKFFLHVSKDVQKERFLERIERPEKNWKFSMADVTERARWTDYQRAYEDALNATSTPEAPWYVIPADHKWVTRSIVAEVLTTTIRSLKPRYPRMTDTARRALTKARRALLNE